MSREKDYSEIIDDAAVEKHEEEVSDRRNELRERVAFLAHVTMPKRPYDLQSVANELRSLALDAEALDKFQDDDPAPLTDEEATEAHISYVSGRVDEAHERMKDLEMDCTV
jgi:hypothetical protein